MKAAGVPCVPGYHGNNQDPQFLFSEAEKIGQSSLNQRMMSMDMVSLQVTLF